MLKRSELDSSDLLNLRFVLEFLSFGFFFELFVLLLVGEGHEVGVVLFRLEIFPLQEPLDVGFIDDP